MMTFSYDKSGDVLYISFERIEGHQYIYSETETGDVLRIDPDTKRVVGLTILFFMKRAKQGKLQLPEVGAAFLSESVPEALLSLSR